MSTAKNIVKSIATPPKKAPKRNSDGIIKFKDYPEFQPNLSPTELFELGSFGGTYFRPIYSSVKKENLKNPHHDPFIKNLFDGIPENKLSQTDYDKSKNKYSVKCGSTLEDWEGKSWIVEQDPYGWVQWYCYFYNGRRSDDDERQIDRWNKLTGKKSGRFRKNLINKIVAANASFDDTGISPVIRQTLQHWAYKPTEEDVYGSKNSSKPQKAKKRKAELIKKSISDEESVPNPKNKGSKKSDNKIETKTAKKAAKVKKVNVKVIKESLSEDEFISKPQRRTSKKLEVKSKIKLSSNKLKEDENFSNALMDLALEKPKNTRPRRAAAVKSMKKSSKMN